MTFDLPLRDYIIQLKVTNKIPWGGYLEIYFPEEIEITANTECKNLTGLASSSKCIIQSFGCMVSALCWIKGIDETIYLVGETGGENVRTKFMWKV